MPVEALAAIGLRHEPRPEDAPRKLALWPESVMPVAVFRRCFTQWHVGGFGGRLGLRYDAARQVYDAMGGAAAEWMDTLDALQVMEVEALTVWGDEAQRKG